MKLYWRVKNNEKWTWRPVIVSGEFHEFHKVMDAFGLTHWDKLQFQEEEE